MLLPIRRCALACLFLLMAALAVGCGDLAVTLGLHEGEGENQAVPAAAAAPETADVDGADGADGDPSGTGVTGGLRDLLGRVDTLTLGALPDRIAGDLQAADRALGRIKRENRAAIRQANRQVRVMSPHRSPNIVLVVAPRLAPGDLGAYGQTQIPTPNLDRLAAAGVRFTDFYAGSPNPLASRWSLLLGMNPMRAAGRGAPRFGIEPEECTVAEMLWQAGYDTGFVGAWGAPPTADINDSPLRHGFEHWMGILRYEDADDPSPESLYLGDRDVELPVNADERVKFTAGDLFVREVIAYLQAHQAYRRPFYLEYHLPRYADYPPELLEAVLPRNADWPLAAQRYAGAVALMDRDIGRLLVALDLLGMDRRTAVLFTALTGPTPARAESLAFFNGLGPFTMAPHGLGEGNLRVPLIARFPGYFPAGSLVEVPAVMWDLYPTLAHLSWAIRKPPLLDGLSLIPAIQGTLDPYLERILLWQSGPAQAARWQQWKAVRPAAAANLALYNLREDPAETKNVATDHPAVLDRLTVPAAQP
jgi:arylsulfatase